MNLFPQYDLDFATVARAAELATAAHQGQTRWDGSPYIFHCYRVASRVAHHGYTSTEAVVTALLHDIVEDTPISLKAVEDMFGTKVAWSVDLLTQRKDESREAYFARCMGQGDGVVLAVKFADRVDNFKGLSTCPEKILHGGHVERYCLELKHHFLPYLSVVSDSLAAELLEAKDHVLSYFQSTDQGHRVSALLTAEAA